MSMSMHCLAVKPADETYRLKAEAYRACEAAGISIPYDLERFFNHEKPDPTGTTQQIGGYVENLHPSCVKYKGDSCEGFEVDVTRLPEGVRFVRFYCSW